MPTLTEKIGRSWANLSQLEPLDVTDKAQITERLYGGYCPLDVARPFLPREMPPRRFGASMTEQELDSIFAEAGLTPRSMLEIGSFWGDTAILAAKTRAIPVLCVDTWLGGLHTWQAPPPRGFLYSGLGAKRGRGKAPAAQEIPPASRFFRQYAANVDASGMLDHITCVRLPSSTGLRYVYSKGLRFDAIYVDGSHDYIDVFTDIALAQLVATERAVIFGDDFQNENVRDAVTDYCAENNVSFVEMPTIRADGAGKRTYWLIRSEHANGNTG